RRRGRARPGRRGPASWPGAQAGRRPGAKELSSSSSVLPRELVVRWSGAVARPRGAEAPERAAQLVGERAAQFRPDEAADRDPLALARELDQRAIAMGGLDPDPRGREIDLLGAPPDRAFDAQAAGAEGQALAVAGVARVDQERRAD